MDDDVDAHDTPAEVDAAFRTLRRAAVCYFVAFVVAVVAFPVLSISLDWWSGSRLVGGLSPGFMMAAFGLYTFFGLVGLAAARLAAGVEARMLGGADQVDQIDEIDEADQIDEADLADHGGPWRSPTGAPASAPRETPADRLHDGPAA